MNLNTYIDQQKFMGCNEVVITIMISSAITNTAINIFIGINSFNLNFLRM